VEAHAGIARAAQELLHSATQLIAQQSAAVRDTTYSLSRVGNPSTTITAHGAARIYQSWTERWRIRERFPQPDWSIIDLWLARKLLAIHVSTTQVEAILRLGSPNFPRHHGDPEGYLRPRRTIAPPRFFLAGCLAPSFYRKILRQDRLRATIAHSVDLQHPSVFVFSARSWSPLPGGTFAR